MSTEAPKKPAEIVDPEAVELSAADHDRIRAKVLKRVAADRKKALEEQLEAKLLEEIQGKAGMLTGDPEEDRIVTLTVDLGQNADKIVINGRSYMHGVAYDVPLHMARSMMEIAYRTQLHEHSITDKPLSLFYAKPRHTVLTRRGTTNAPRRPDEGLQVAG